MRLKMRSYLQQFSAAVAVLVAMGVAAPAQDLKIIKKTTVGEASFSSETLLKGARERTALQIAGAPATVTIRQCDLKRSVTLSDQSKAYLVAKDPEDDSVNRAAALVSGDAGAPSVGGKVTVTSTVTDTGERKTLFGYPARHLKTTVVAASSPNACSPVNQKYQIDGWYIDLKDRAACKGFVPPIHSDVANCTDKVVTRQVGTAKPGFPINETITISNPDGPPTVVNSEVTALDKQTLAADLFHGHSRTCNSGSANCGACPNDASVSTYRQLCQCSGRPSTGRGDGTDGPPGPDESASHDGKPASDDDAGKCRSDGHGRNANRYASTNWSCGCLTHNAWA